MTNQIGLHMTKNGAGKGAPYRVVLSMNGNGVGGDEQHPDTIIIGRDTTVYKDGPPDINHPPGTYAQMAAYWCPQLHEKMKTWGADYYVITNELGGSWEYDDNKTPEENEAARAEVVQHIKNHIAYEKECVIFFQENYGMKSAVCKLANGNPSPDAWWREYYVPFILWAWGYNQSIYARHCYGGELKDENGDVIKLGNLVEEDGSISTQQPNNPSRIIDELEYLKSLGWNGGMVLAETGLDGGYGVADWNRFYFQVTKFEQALRPYADNIIGFCWWECGADTGWGADYTNYLKEMTPYIEQNSIPKWKPPTAVVPPIEPPTEGTTEEKIFAMSQSWAFPVNEDAALQAVALGDGYTPSGEEQWHTVDGVKYAMQPFYKVGDTNTKRSYYAVVGDWGNVKSTDGTTPNEVFSFVSWPTPHRVVTQEFLANPQSYTQFGLPGHEGVDIRAYHGDAVYAVADGVISDIHFVDDGHNYGIFIRVLHADNYETTYAHLKETIRAVGEVVTAGAIIGLADNTGNSNGDHLHLTLKKKGQTFTDRCGNVWPHEICDPTSFMLHFSGVTWPGGSPGFPCPGEPTEPPPVGNKIDLLPYIKGDGRLYEVRNSSGGQERFQTQYKGVGEFWQTKNGLAEQLVSDDGMYIYRGWDTSPGNGRYYVQQQSGTDEAQWLPRHMAINEVFTVSLRVQFYDWNCQPVAENSGNVTDTRRLVAHYPVWTSPYGITLNDVIKIEWVNGGEFYWYAHDFGLVGWGRTHNDPNTPASSGISEIHAPGQRPDNVVDLPECLA